MSATPWTSPFAGKTVSCAFCRQRKLRCNRVNPCSSCTKHNRPCYYGEQTGDARNEPRDRSSAKREDLRGRVARLELLLREAQASDINVATPTIQPSLPERRTATHQAVDTIPKHGGVTQGEKVVQTEMYTPPDHWSAVLEGLDNVKHVLEDAENPFELSSSQSEGNIALSSNIFGYTGNTSKEDILKEFPSRHISDRLINTFFTVCKDPCVLIFHASSFQRKYQAFWDSPNTATYPLFATILGMFALAIEFGHRASVPLPLHKDNVRQSANRYRDIAFSAITMSGCSLSRALDDYVLEALVLQSTALFYFDTSAYSLLSQVLASMIRLAMRSGYHRDASHHKHITAFKGEMRRRLWFCIKALDVIMSHQTGLPRVIQDWQFDTKPPSNLRDDEIDGKTLRLPPSRPETEQTPVLYMIAKGRLMTAVGAVLDCIHSLLPVDYNTIYELDLNLQKAYSGLPVCFHLKPLGETLADPGPLRMQRYSFNLTFYQARSLLHRKNLSDNDTNDFRAAWSRGVCIDSALTCLQHQFDLHEEIQPSGCFYRERWFVSSLLLDCFLHASMIICVELHVLQQTPHISQISRGHTHTKAKLHEALEKTFKCWEIWTEHSSEARKASRVLAIILGGSKKESVGDTATTEATTRQSNLQNNAGSAVRESEAVVDTDMMNMVGILPHQSDQVQLDGFFSLPTLYNLDSLTEADWNLFDTFLQMPNHASMIE